MNVRPTRVEVDLGAIRHNVQVLRRAVGVPLAAVVKANAYGHGAVPVARAALQAGASRLCVATVEEGLALRRAGIGSPVLVLGWTPPEALPDALAGDLTLTVFDEEGLEAAADAARRSGRPARVHLKIDTGMGRLGFPAWAPGVAAEILAAARRPGLDVEGVYTHFACADVPGDRFTAEQAERFAAVVAALRAGGLPIRIVHAANSAAALSHPGTRFDLVRIGIALYGLEPYPGAFDGLSLRPALAWRTRVAQVKTLAPGMGVSYGRTFVPDRPLRVAVLPVGYADGYDRGLSNRGQVLVGGRRVRVLGRVCMDQIIVGEVGEDVRPGDEVVLLGRQGSEEITAGELAGWLDTIHYEVVTRIGPRVPRVYVDGDAGGDPAPAEG